MCNSSILHWFNTMIDYIRKNIDILLTITAVCFAISAYTYFQIDKYTERVKLVDLCTCGNITGFSASMQNCDEIKLPDQMENTNKQIFSQFPPSLTPMCWSDNWWCCAKWAERSCKYYCADGEQCSDYNLYDDYENECYDNYHKDAAICRQRYINYHTTISLILSAICIILGPSSIFILFVWGICICFDNDARKSSAFGCAPGPDNSILYFVLTL